VTALQPFADSTEHLLAELERIDLLIRSRIAHLRRVQSEDEHFRGLYISEQEIDALLDRPLGAPQWLNAESKASLGPVDQSLQALAGRLRARCQLSLQQGVELRLERLARLFELDAFDIGALLVCIAVEIDLRYEKLYAYLQDDVTRKRPSAELVIQLLTDSPATRLAARRHFLASSPLVSWQLIQLLDDASQPQAQNPVLAKYVKPADRVVQFLLGIDDIDERLRGMVEASADGKALNDLLMGEPERRAFREAWRVAAPGPGQPAGPVMVLAGASGSGKRSVAAALCHECGGPLLAVNLAAMPAEADLSRQLRLIERDAALLGAAIYWHGGIGEPAEGEAAETLGRQRGALASVWRAIDTARVPCIWAGGDVAGLGSAFTRRGSITLRLPLPTHAQRTQLWSRELAGARCEDEVDLSALASRFKLNFGAIVQAAASARRIARLRADAEAPLSLRDLFDACRLHSNQKLSALARKSTPHHRWSDIVLPADRVAQLREICNHVKYRERVYGDWGFGAKLVLGKGLAVLFAGPSGTGKTMAAGIIASELGLDLYRIDLSTVISKYIGETEKNLSKIFDEAETSNAILFFDEADALFGKRSEVRDSHDRYANIEVGYLLQRMEQYEGIAILATNFRKNMDEAFVRRLHFTIEFPFPDHEDRHRIWQGIWPADTPRDSALDLHLLARRFEMTGGNIKNVALAAAFLAADGDQIVSMNHVMQATQREFQKTGKLLGDFSDPVGGEDRARQ